MSKRPPSLPAQAADMAMQMALRQIDFNRAPAPRPAAPVAKQAAPTPLPSPPSDEHRLALRRRDWLADVQEAQRALSPYASGLLTAENLSGEEFLHSFYAPGRPVLIKGAMTGWPALERWTPDYLADRIGDAEIEYQGGRSSAADYELKKDRHRKRATFRHFIDLGRAGGNDA